MATDEERFLQAIEAHPDDDESRLVYADWLEERGDPRGEFIRVQCEMEEAEGVDSRRWMTLLGRQEQLLAEYRETWAPSPIPEAKWMFERGLPVRLAVPYEHLWHSLDYLLTFDPVPFLDIVRFDVRHRAPDFELLQQVTQAAVHPNVNDDVIAYLTQQGIPDLVSLDLSYNRSISWVGIRNLARFPFTQLSELWLNENRIDDTGLQALGRSKQWTGLSQLSLRGNDFSVRGVSELFGGPPFRLKKLDLRDNHLGDALAEPLELESLAELRRLNLRNTQAGDAAAQTLAGREDLSLEYLDLSRNQIGDAGAVALAESASLAAVKRLNLLDNPIRPAAENLLRERFGRRVQLGETPNHHRMLRQKGQR